MSILSAVMAAKWTLVNVGEPLVTGVQIWKALGEVGNALTQFEGHLMGERLIGARRRLEGRTKRESQHSHVLKYCLNIFYIYIWGVLY